ncbi:MAG TPA: methyltransferase domain-containing protein [Roseiflexaceae bacterium]|nr:methyltransferase domain-containing protein [Roseiflexaceae bacterium]
MLNRASFKANALPETTERHTRSALNAVLQTVFAQTWVGQQRFTTTVELDALHAALGVGPGARVLEIGSGLGGSAIYLARQTGCRVVSIDASPAYAHNAAVAAAAAGLGDRVRFIAGEITETAFPAGAFDAIVSHDTFVAIEDKARVFELCRRWLRPGGRLAAMLIVRQGDIPAGDALGAPLAWPLLTTSDYQALVARAGLQVVALDDLSAAFREIGARWRGALLVWELALLSNEQFGWERLRDTTERLAEWSTQGLLGHIQLIVSRDEVTQENDHASDK